MGKPGLVGAGSENQGYPENVGNIGKDADVGGAVT